MLDPKIMDAIKIARNEYQASLVSRMGREAKKTALANVLINAVESIIDTCLEAEDLLNALAEERSRSAELMKKLDEMTAAQAPAKNKKNG